MMAADEKKPVKSHPIPLEVDPASILSLSKGVIFDTIVHNVEYTMSNRRTDPLPWKLAGMSLICDPSRNKKYMQKLQKMQCVPSVICTQIYHSRLVKTESGVLTTPGRKICIPTQPPRRLTGIIVCRSIDELLYMEPPTTENVHIIQYKLLSYERLATRELVNGPKVSTVGDRLIKTVFDFELTQNHGFPRQLLPVAIITFTRDETGDLCTLIRSFLDKEEHKMFDKSYLVTSTNVECDRLREEQERKEDAEAEEELPGDIIQRRQPLADLSKKSTDTGNARPLTVTQSAALPSALVVPPLKIKYPRLEKPIKPWNSILPIDRKFHCSLQLERVDLSQYEISNLPNPPQIKAKKSIEPTPATNAVNQKKPFTVTKAYDRHKPLKRLNTGETKKHSPSLSEASATKRPDVTVPIRVSTSAATVLATNDEKNKERSLSASSMSPIFRPIPPSQKRPVEKPTKKVKVKVKRPVLAPEYRCSLSLTPVDLSIYDLDLPPIPVAPSNSLPKTTESTLTNSSSNSSSPSSSSSSEKHADASRAPIESESAADPIQPIFSMEQDNLFEPEEQHLFDAQTFDDIQNNAPFPPNIMDEFLTPDLNDPLFAIDMDAALPSAEEIALRPPELPTSTTPVDVSSSSIYETVTEVARDMVSAVADEVPSENTNAPSLSLTNETAIDAAGETAVTVTDPDRSETIPQLPALVASDVAMETTDEAQSLPTDTVQTATNNEVPVASVPETESILAQDENIKSVSPASFLAFSPDLPLLDDDPVLFSVESPSAPAAALPSDPNAQEYLIIVPCSDDEGDFDDEDILMSSNNMESKMIDLKSIPPKSDASPLVNNPLLTRILTNINCSSSDRLSISSSSSSCSALSTSMLPSQCPQSSLHLKEVLLSQKIRSKKERQQKSFQTMVFTQFNAPIPLLAHESLIDPRLIYRLQAITTDLRWPDPCNQCSISEHRSPPLHSVTQMISHERRLTSEYVDPRRESLQNTILNSIYQRLKILMPNLVITNSNQFQKLLFEQTAFKTNCSLHLEDLLEKIKLIDDMHFLHLLKSNDEFNLSSDLLQLIFN